MWYNEYGYEFKTEKEARKDAVERMETDGYYSDFLAPFIDFDDLLEFALAHKEEFFSEFGKEVKQAENDFFETYYHKKE